MRADHCPGQVAGHVRLVVLDEPDGHQAEAGRDGGKPGDEGSERHRAIPPQQEPPAASAWRLATARRTALDPCEGGIRIYPQSRTSSPGSSTYRGPIQFFRPVA